MISSLAGLRSSSAKGSDRHPPTENPSRAIFSAPLKYSATSPNILWSRNFGSKRRRKGVSSGVTYGISVQPWHAVSGVSNPVRASVQRKSADEIFKPGHLQRADRSLLRRPHAGRSARRLSSWGCFRAACLLHAESLILAMTSPSSGPRLPGTRHPKCPTKTYTSITRGFRPCERLRERAPRSQRRETGTGNIS